MCRRGAPDGDRRDASAAVLGLLNHGDARRALASEAVAVPHLADSEVANALRSQVLRGTAREGEARVALDRWAQLGIRRFAVVGLLARIWALRANLTCYDATVRGAGRGAWAASCSPQIGGWPAPADPSVRSSSSAAERRDPVGCRSSPCPTRIRPDQSVDRRLQGGGGAGGDDLAYPVGVEVEHHETGA